MSRDPEELWAHAGWLRRLARSLVRQGADDLVQETWVAALRHPPRTDLPLRPWLAQVLRNLVRMRRRHGAVVARSRDAQVALEGERAAAAPSPEALLSRLESERLLSRLVAELREPYRQTVLLRYHEGHSAAAIARMLGIPAATVRSRLKTALDGLRAELDAAHGGDRRTWTRALVPLALAAPRAGAGPFLKGLWIMTRTQKLGAAAIALLALLGLLTVGVRRLTPERASPEAAQAPPPGTAPTGHASATPPSPPAAPAAPAAPAEVGVSLTSGGAARVAHEPALPHGAFSGRVVNWSTGAGVSGAQVIFDGEGGTQPVTTDEEGRFRLEPPAAGRYVLAVASAPGFLPYAPEWGVSPISLVARPGLRIADVTLYLRPAIDYTGVVEDPAGKPVAGAAVRLLGAALGEQAQSPLADRFTTDARGEFVFHAPDDALLEARHPRFGPGRARLDGPAAVSHRLTIKLRPRGKDDALLGAATITGRVIDARKGPVAGALVRAEHVDHEADHPIDEATADAGGRFTLEGLDPGLHVVRAICDGCAAATARAMTGTEVTLEVSAAGVLSGRVLSGDGAPVPAFTVVVTRPQGVAEQTVDTATVVDAEGRFEIAGLEPGPYRVRAMAHGHANSPPRDVAVAAAAEPQGEIVLQLSVGGVIHGKVVDRATGEPLAWARVTIDGGVGDGTTALPLQVSTVTDPDGSFVLTGVPPGLHSVIAAAYAHHMSMASSLRVEEGGRVGPLLFKLRATKEGEVPRLELAGIGARLRASEDALVIDGVIDGGGAALAGLMQGDAIVKIDGQLVTDIGFQDAIQRIRGPEGSQIQLGIRRDGKVTDVAVERRAISL